MPTDFHVNCELPFRADLFWPLRATPIFLNFLLSDGCLSHMQSFPDTADPSQPELRLRKQVYAPQKMDIPDFIQAFLPTKLILVNDIQRWNPNSTQFKQHFQCKPTVLPDYVTTGGSLSVENKNEEWCTHTIEGKTEVSMPYVGWYMEQAIVRNMQVFYESYPKHVERFKWHLVERFGEGDRERLEVAVKKALQCDEKEGKEEKEEKEEL